MSTETPGATDPELRAIELDANAIANEQSEQLNPPDPNAPPPAPIDPTQDARDILDFAHASLTPLYPSLGKVYTEEVRQRIAVAGGRLLAKYGVTLADIFGRWSEEIGFAMVVLPLVVPTVQAIRHDRAAAENPPAAAPKVEAAADAPTFPEPAAGPNPLERFGQ
jgi:hypothetical protein